MFLAIYRCSLYCEIQSCRRMKNYGMQSEYQFNKYVNIQIQNFVLSYRVTNIQMGMTWRRAISVILHEINGCTVNMCSFSGWSSLEFLSFSVAPVIVSLLALIFDFDLYCSCIRLSLNCITRKIESAFLRELSDNKNYLKIDNFRNSIT